MVEFEPKKKIKIINKEFIAKYAYVFVLAVLLIGGISYGYTFFTQNRKIASGSITTANLTINFTDRTINASSLSKPTSDQEGLSEFTKSLTITNTTAIDGRVKLSLTRTSGLELSDLKYALIINGAIQEVSDVPANGEILSSAIMGNEVINVEVRLWPKTTYAGSETTFVGELTPEIKYLGSKATTSISAPAGKYVNFNCNGTTCELWRIVKVENGRLVLTRENDYSGADERTNSNKYDTSLTFNDNSMITSVSTDGLNVYLARTVKIDGGEGTQSNPYTLVNTDFREPDKKVIAQITYKDENNTTIGTQNIYYNETNYISQVIDDPNFQGWTDGTNDFALGDVVTLTSDTVLTAKIVQTLKNKIMSLCNDSNVAYVQKYDAINNGAAMDTPDGSGSEDVCYYTTTLNTRNTDAEQNANVIFGDYCWQIVRTTADGGVKLLYNGPKTADNKCPSDADTANYSSNPRPSSIGVVGTTGTKYTTISGSKIYGDSFEIYDDGGTNKFRLKNTSTASWSDSTYQNLIGKYVCGTSSSPTGDATTCEVMYYVGHYQSNTEASTEKYTIGTNAHYSQIGTSSFNAYSDSPALVGYMYNDVYRVMRKDIPTNRSNVINKQPARLYYYGDTVSWDGTYYHLIDSSTNQPPTTTSPWKDIRSDVKGKYTCMSGDPTTGTYCTTVYYVVANSNGSDIYSIPLSNNENKDKTVTWHYGTSVTKVGDTYTLMDGNNTSALTKTFKLADWYTDYAQYRDIYVCDDFTSITCTAPLYITYTDYYQETHYTLDYTYYFASDIVYDSSTNTYSYDTNESITEIYDWITQYNTIYNTRYMCEHYNPMTHSCDTNETMHYVLAANTSIIWFIELNGENNVSVALTNMLSKDVAENGQVVTVNKYNSAIKGVIDNWYKQNIDDKNLTNYLDDDAVYCNDRTITDYGSWGPNITTTGGDKYYLKFKHYNSTFLPSKSRLECNNETDRFSGNNIKAKLVYPIGLLTKSENAMMYRGYIRTGQDWWGGGSPSRVETDNAHSFYVNSSGNYYNRSVSDVEGVRPAIVLKPGIEIASGDGTYNNPYVIDTTSS